MLHSLVLIAASCTPIQAPDTPPSLNIFPQLTYYYRKPDPALGPKLLTELLAKLEREPESFNKNPEALPIAVALLGDLAWRKPSIVRAYETEFSDATDHGKSIIVQILTTCGDQRTRQVVAGWLQDPDNPQLMNALNELQVELANPRREHLRDRQAETALEIDQLWANFYITGEYLPVSRVLDVLDLPNTLEHVVLRDAAMRSLRKHLADHQRVVDLVLEHRIERPVASRHEIDELLRDLAAARPHGGMLKIVYRDVTPNIEPDSFGGQPRTLYRLGSKLGRFEEPFNPATGVHGQIIVNHPHVWMVDVRRRTALYIVDKDPIGDLRVPVLEKSAAPELFKELELGREREFMRENDAKPDGSELIGGKAYPRQVLEQHGLTIALVTDPASATPLLLTITRDGEVMRQIRYDSYEPGVKADLGLFRVPEGVAIRKGK